MDEQVKKEKSSLATVALVLGIIGVVLSVIPIIRFISCPLAIISIILAIISVGKKKSVVKAIIALLLAIAALVITITLQIETTRAVSDAMRDMSEGLNDLSGDNTENILKNDLKVEIGEFQITQEGFFAQYKLPVSVKNISENRASFSIKIEAVDSEGKRLKEDIIFVSDLNAGQTQDCEAFTLITSADADALKNATFKIVEVSKY